MNGPAIVTIDIETSPLVSMHWRLWDETIAIEQIVEEWSILSFSAKWLGQPGIIYRDTGGRGARHVRDDRTLLRDLWNILDKADIVIGHNAKAFDVKKVNARLIMHGFKPYQPLRVIDTMLIARGVAEFSANKLAYLTRHLTRSKKLLHKRFPGFSLWKECLNDNPAAWREMKAYNRRDVVATEELYLKLRPWMVGHPNVAVYSASEEIQCPKCGSHDIQMRGRAFTQTGEYHRFQCKECGGWARSRYTLNSREKRQVLASN